MVDQPPGSDETSDASRQVAPLSAARYATRVAKLLHRVAQDDLSPYKEERQYLHQFYVDDDILGKIKSRALTALTASEPIDDNVEFAAQARFPNASIVRFTDYTDFMDRSSDDRDPESARLAWSKFSIGEDGEPLSGEVKVSFVTEKRLATEELEPSPGVVHRAFVQPTVAGSNKQWVDRTVQEIEPSMRATRLGGIYTPLWIFRSKYFVEVLSYFLGFTGFNVGFRIVLAYFDSHNTTTQEILAKIHQADVNQKLDLIAAWLMSPTLTSTVNMLVCMGVGFGVAAIVTVTAMYGLPRLAPKSIIAVGYAKRRAESYLNIMRVFVLGTAVSAIFVPIIRGLWSYLSN